MLNQKIKAIEHSDLPIPSFIKKGVLESLYERLRAYNTHPMHEPLRKEIRERDLPVLMEHYRTFGILINK